MPIYEFRCEPCDRKFDVLFRSADERRKPKCPTCGKSRVRKLFSAFAMSGSGSSGKGGGCGTCRATSCAGCKS